MSWSQVKLTKLIRQRSKYRGRFEESSDLDADGNYVWLAGIKTPTTAISIADMQLASRIPKIDDAMDFEEGFFEG